MTDVWKSNARKFCEICKVWFADNRVSIEHHESGQKHKAAIQAKLRELARQNKEKQKANASLEATLALMESAALSSMKKDKTTSTVSSCSTSRPSSKPKSYFDPRAHQESLEEIAQEIARRKKKYINEQLKESLKDEDSKASTNTTQKNTSEEPVWVQALSDEGVPYYFHMYSGETTWETPMRFFTAEEYSCKYAKIKQEMSNVLPSTSNDGKIKGGDKTISGEECAEKVDLKPEISEETRIAMAANFCLGDAEIPLPPSGDQPSTVTPTFPLVKFKIKTEVEEDGSSQLDPNVYIRVNDSSTTIESIESEYKNVQPEAKLNDDKSEENSHPYGAWKRVEKSPEPEKIDYGLPIEAKIQRKKDEVEIRSEDVVVFSEKTAPISRKKKNLDAPVQFKKRKTNLSIRKQGNTL